MPLRVLICNQIYLYARGLQHILEKDGDIASVEISQIDRLQDELQRHAPDLVIADIYSFSRLPHRGEKVLLIWGRPEADPSFNDLKEFVDLGMVGILDARTTPALLRKALWKIAAGELWVDHKTIHNFLYAPSPANPRVTLSRRETEVLTCICAGCSNKEIADRLCICNQTVKTHCNHLFKKFGVTSRLQLALRATSADSGHPLEQRTLSQPLTH